MAVTFGNLAQNGYFAGTDTTNITPAAGSDYQVSFAARGSADTAFTVTFASTSMGLLLSRLNDSEGGLFGRSIRMHGLAGDYTGSSRAAVWSQTDLTRCIATFAGVDQSDPVLHTQVQRTFGDTEVAMTISGANNPVGSRVVWGLSTFQGFSGDVTCDEGTVHATLDQQDFSNGGAFGSIAGTGSSLTFTVTKPGSTTDLLLFAVVLAEASAPPEPAPPRVLISFRPPA
jgi:hypothetical protein